MSKYDKLSPPKRGSKITVAKNGQLQVPDDPVVPFIRGDGIPPEMWSCVQEVLEIAVDRCYANAKRLEWMEVFAGEKANEIYGPNNRLPEDTIRAIQEYKVCIKGSITTPVGAPTSLDALLRDRLELFAVVQPVRYIDGVSAPLHTPGGMNLTIFREHSEDVFCELEWKKGSPEAKQLITLLNNDLVKRMGKSIRPDSSIGIKPISATATKRLIRLALEYAIKHKRRSLTFVHSGQIMRQTEGFFRDWGYELAAKEFGEYTVSEQEVNEQHQGIAPRGKLVVMDRQTDHMLQQLLVSPEEFDVLVTTNLNGLFLQSQTLASVGGQGLAPKAHMGAKAAVFETTHQALPRHEGKHHSPVSTLLCGVMLFDHLGWKDAAELVTNALVKTISDNNTTADMARKLKETSPQIRDTKEFCELLIENFEEVRKSSVRQAIKQVVSAR